MAKFQIAVYPGDGIGPDVTVEALARTRRGAKQRAGTNFGL